jgi:P pilus assembly chaperone PapD
MKLFSLSARAWSLAACLLASPAFASQVSVAPVRIDIDQQTPIGSVRVYNHGDQPVVMETSTKIWNQAPDGQWLLSPTQNVKAYPGLIKMPAQGSAVVRVGLAPGTAIRSGQGTYRLFLRELVDQRASSGANVRMVLSVNLPVFVNGAPASTQPGATTQPGTTTQGELTANMATQGIVNFVLRNSLSAPSIAPQAADYLWQDASGKTIATTHGKIDAYALPGGLGRWNEVLSTPCKTIEKVRVTGESGVAWTAPLSCKR